MANALVESAKGGVALPWDVYDTVAWSVVTSESELSTANNGGPQYFPDFTWGCWISRSPDNWIKETY